VGSAIRGRAGNGEGLAEGSPLASEPTSPLFATKVRKAHGLEAAQVLLGHARADVTQVYAERNEELAREVAGKIG